MEKKLTEEKEKKPKIPTKPDSKVVAFVKTVLPAVLLYLVMRTMLVETFRIPSGSMENTLQIGDFLFANKMLYGAEVPLIGAHLPAIREPRLDDLVVFDSVEEPGLKVVKRIVGSAGDTIRMINAVLHRNGQIVDEPWSVQSEPLVDPAMPQMRGWQLPRVLLEDKAAYHPSVKNWGPLVVPVDSFFVMGDNRDNSYDSRYWGFLGRDRIEAHPMLIYYSYDKNGILPLPAITSIRWGRIASRPR
jgi:signal peptidase I